MEITEKIKALDADRELWYADHEGGEPTLLNTDDLKSLVTLIEQQSAVIEEAEKALGLMTGKCRWGDCSCSYFHESAASTLARILQIRGEAK